MMSCKYYYAYIESTPLNPPLNTRYHTKVIGRCSGTSEREICCCNGDESKCDFYDYIKEHAIKETVEYKIKEAIELLESNGYSVKKL